MPNPAILRTPGYRFKDGRLMIFDEHGVMLIHGWEEPSAVSKSDGAWEPFVPEFRLVAPYRRATKPAAKKVAKTPPSPATATGQLEFGLFGTDVPSPQRAAKPAMPITVPLAEQRKKAFDAFRFSLPKEIARVLEPFRSHQWPLLVLLAHDKQVLDLAATNPVLAYAVADWYADCVKPTEHCPCHRSRASRAGSSGFRRRPRWWPKDGSRKTASPVTPPVWWPGIVTSWANPGPVGIGLKTSLGNASNP